MVEITEYGEIPKNLNDKQFQDFISLFISDSESDCDFENEDELINQINQSAQKYGLNIENSNTNEGTEKKDILKSSILMKSLIATSSNFSQLCQSKVAIGGLTKSYYNSKEEIIKTTWKELGKRPKPSSDPLEDSASDTLSKEEKKEEIKAEAKAFLIHHSQVLEQIDSFESELISTMVKDTQDFDQKDKEKKAVEELKDLLEKINSTKKVLKEYLKVLESNLKEIDDPDYWIIVQQPNFFWDSLTSLQDYYNHYFLRISLIYAEVKPVIDILTNAYDIYTSVVPAVQTIITCIPIVLAFLSSL